MVENMGDHGVLLPRRFGDPIAVATPQIDNFNAIAVNRDSGSHLLTAGHVIAKTSATLPYPPSTSPAMRSGDTLTLRTMFVLTKGRIPDQCLERAFVGPPIRRW